MKHLNIYEEANRCLLCQDAPCTKACLKATSWMPADRDYFRGGGYSSHFVTKGGMPTTAPARTSDQSTSNN